MSDNILVIFAKYPELGKVKTRLAKDIGDKKALEIYTSLLSNIIAEHKDQEYDLIISVLPKEKEQTFKNMFNVKTMAQYGDNLGMSMYDTFLKLTKYEKVILIGSDIPEANSGIITRAFKELNNKDIVLGPNPDGGYYLVGMNSPHNIFSDITWSTDRVLQGTIQKIKTQELTHTLLEELNDIDTIEDYDKYCLSRELCE